jgi:alpha-L-arabinofuranosidase
MIISDISKSEPYITSIDNNCSSNIEIKKSDTYSIIVRNTTINYIKPSYYGFNLEYSGFQDSWWNKKDNTVNNSITSALKNDFPQAIYRYPGGSVSNYFNWKESIGYAKNRQKQKVIDWKKANTINFGIDEYFNFLEQVDGYPWYVLNIQGGFFSENSVEQLIKDTQELYKYMSSNNRKIYSWELGNQLDRGVFNWTVEKYINRTKKIIHAFHNRSPSEKFTFMLRDYNVDGPGSAKPYNRELIKGTKSLDQDYVLHQYYDAPQGGPTITNRLKYICHTLNLFNESNLSNGKIWITEHARAPVKINKKKGWKKHYEKTVDLSSAISTADYLVGLTQIPEVKGAFIHALSHTKGPWSLFHTVNGEVKKSVVYWAIQMIRHNHLPEVLKVDIKSRNTSKYIGGYDVRASVYTNKERSKYKIVFINRSSMSSDINITIPELSNKKIISEITELSDINDKYSNKYYYRDIKPLKRKTELEFNRHGMEQINIPGYSVTSVYFDL